MFVNEYDINSLKKIIPNGQSFEMFVTPRYIGHYVNNIYEPMTTRIITSNVSEGGIFVDVGAHYGYFSVLAGKQSKASRILAFEPVPINFQILQQNVAINNLQNIELFNLAVSDGDEVRKFNIAEASDSCSFYDHPLASTIEEIDVKTVALDSIFRDPVDVEILVKIDAEGHEISILEGMEKFIKKSRQKLKLIVEYNPKMLERAQRKPGELVSRLFSLGFQVFIVDETKGALQKIDRAQADNYYDELRKLNDPTDYVNLFCVPVEQSLSLIFFSHSSGMNGAERSLLTLVTALMQKGVECTVILPSEGALRTNLENLGATTLVFSYEWWADKNYLNAQLRQEKLLNGFNIIWNEILPRLKQINPDIIVTDTSVIPWGAICAFLLDKPHLWYVHEFGGIDHELRYFYPQKIISKYIEGSSNAVITNSKATKRYFFGESAGEKIHTIYPAMDHELIYKTESESHPYFVHEEYIKLTVIGTMQTGKGQLDAIDAVNELITEGKKVELVLAGYADPDYQDSLKRLIQQHHLQSFVHIIGFLENPYPLFKQADIVLVCSLSEAFGRVTLEAMLLGKPIVATNSGGTPELITDGSSGYLYAPGDYKELANKIRDLIENPEKRNQFGLKAAQYALENFSNDASITNFFNLLRAQKTSPNHSSHEFIYWVNELIQNHLSDLVVDYTQQISMGKQSQDMLQSKLEEQELRVAIIKEKLAEEDRIKQGYVTELERQKDKYEGEISQKDQILRTILSRLAKKQDEITFLETDKKILIEQLAISTSEATRFSSQLWEIKQSRAWKIVQFIWKTRLRVLPPGSTRANFVRSIITDFRILNNEGFKSFIKQLFSKPGEPVSPKPNPRGEIGTAPQVSQPPVSLVHPDPVYIPDVLGGISARGMEYSGSVTTTTNLDALWEQVSSQIKYREFTISISHDDYLTVNYGVQMFISDEQGQYDKRRISYLHFYPINGEDYLQDDAQISIGVNIDSINVGQYCVEDVVRLLERLISAQYTCMSVNLHHLKGWTLTALFSIISGVNSGQHLYYVHDYFAICPQYNLLRNQREFCNAPDVESNSCTICEFGHKRKMHQPFVKELFARFPFTVITPSESSQVLWKKAFPDFAHSVRVEPHLLLNETDFTLPVKNYEEIRIAYVGQASPHKGWDVWRKFVDQFATYKEFELFHLGSWVGSYPENFENVKVSPGDRSAMLEALRRNEIDVVFHWAIWPETFSYVLYEAIGAGCFILTSHLSGNVADFVAKNKNGIIFLSFSNLVEHLSDPDLLRRELMEFRLRQPKAFSLQQNDVVTDSIKPILISD